MAAPWFDTMLAAQLLSGGIGGTRHSLEELSLRYLNRPLDKSTRLSDWSQPTLSASQLVYAAKDARILLELYRVLEPVLTAKRLYQVAQIEFGAMPRVAQMELQGMGFDRESWQKLTTEMIEQRDKTAQAAYKVFSKPTNQLSLFEEHINLDSTAEVLQVLQTKGIPAQNTNKSTIALLAVKYPEVALIRDYRHWAKAVTAFGMPLPEKVSPVTGRIHPHIRQIGAASGRVAFTSPNLQQIPREKKYRACFIPAPGNVLIIADYSQIELRIIAQIAGDQRMIEAYRQGQDLHKLTASLILHKPLAAITKSDRQIAKSANFGLVYGMGTPGFKRYAAINYGVELTMEEAQAFRDSFFKSYTRITAWHQQTKRAKYDQRVTSCKTLSGRLRCWSKSSPPSINELLNTPVQGTSADMTKLALMNLSEELDALGAFPIVIVHDEIVLETPKEHALRAKVLLEEAMLAAGARFLTDVPVEVETVVATSWAEK